MPDFADILARLDDMATPYPAAAIQTLNEHRESAAPVLRQVLRDVLADPKAYDKRIVQMHVAALLAEWGDGEAHDLLARLCRLDEEASEAVWCDFTTEGLPECLVATFQQDSEPLLQVIADREAHEWGRVAATRALGRLACEGRCDIEVVTARLLGIATTHAESLRNSGHFGDVVLAVLAAELVPFLSPDRVETELLPWFETGIATSGLVSVHHLRARAGDRDYALQYGHARYADIRACNLVDHLHLAEPATAAKPFRRLPAQPQAPAPIAPPAMPFRRDQAKVGRNDPCPCGSGRKSKKCCAA
jgi:hypothetical protein